MSPYDGRIIYNAGKKEEEKPCREGSGFKLLVTTKEVCCLNAVSRRRPSKKGQGFSSETFQCLRVVA